jgi:hypothetical protein
MQKISTNSPSYRRRNPHDAKRRMGVSILGFAIDSVIEPLPSGRFWKSLFKRFFRCLSFVFVGHGS